MPLTKEQIKKLAEKLAGNFTLNSYMKLDAEALNEKLQALNDYITNPGDVTDKEFDAELNIKYKEMYVTFFSQAVENEKKNPATKKFEKEHYQAPKSKSERKQILNAFKRDGDTEENLALLRNCSKEDLAWLKNEYEKFTKECTPEVKNLFKEKKSLKAYHDKIEDKIYNNKRPWQFQIDKMEEAGDRLLRIPGELEENEDYQNALNTLKTITAAKKTAEENYQQAYDHVDSAVRDSATYFEKTMKAVWNVVIKENVKGEGKNAPVSGGMTSDEVKAIKNSVYVTKYDSRREKGTVIDTKILRTNVNNTLKIYTRKENPETSPDTLIDSLAVAYKRLMVNFSNRGFLGKLFHLNEYFAARNVINTLKRLGPDDDHSEEHAELRLNEQARSQDQLKSNIYLTLTVNKLSNFIYRHEDVEYAEEEKMALETINSKKEVHLVIEDEEDEEKSLIGIPEKENELDNSDMDLSISDK